MQAARGCRVTSAPETGTVVFEVSMVGQEGSAASKGMHKENADWGEKGTPADAEGLKDKVEEGDKPKGDAEEKERRPKDPICMFGILTPQALRLAQAGAIKMVEEIVPKLVEVDAEMKEMEIKIRRARKHRAKAEALENGDEKIMAGESRKEAIVS
jgi:hypothetical protein